MPSSRSVDLVIDGLHVRAVYSDDLIPLIDVAEAVRTTRASHVEPVGSRWLADMGPSGGPVLAGGDGLGFVTRQAALDAERDWLRENRGL